MMRRCKRILMLGAQVAKIILFVFRRSPFFLYKAWTTCCVYFFEFADLNTRHLWIDYQVFLHITVSD
jgi:hypothetical protein